MTSFYLGTVALLKFEELGLQVRYDYTHQTSCYCTSMDQDDERSSDRFRLKECDFKIGRLAGNKESSKAESKFGGKEKFMKCFEWSFLRDQLF